MGWCQWPHPSYSSIFQAVPGQLTRGKATGFSLFCHFQPIKRVLITTSTFPCRQTHCVWWGKVCSSWEPHREVGRRCRGGRATSNFSIATWLGLQVSGAVCAGHSGKSRAKTLFPLDPFLDWSLCLYQTYLEIDVHTTPAQAQAQAQAHAHSMMLVSFSTIQSICTNDQEACWGKTKT